MSPENFNNQYCAVWPRETLMTQKKTQKTTTLVRETSKIFFIFTSFKFEKFRLSSNDPENRLILRRCHRNSFNLLVEIFRKLIIRFKSSSHHFYSGLKKKSTHIDYNSIVSLNNCAKVLEKTFSNCIACIILKQ